MSFWSTIREIARVVSNRGIEANPMKIMAITDMGVPATIKDV
jgi:hypothetical protein